MTAIPIEDRPDVLIVGGGIMGLMTAWELALAGARVALLERGEPGREASWAGGGIVSPLYPWRYAAPVTALAQAARAAYPSLAAHLREATGIDPGLFPCGMLMLDAPDASKALAWASELEETVEAWDRARIASRVPGVAAHWRSGLWMPAIANVRNPHLLRALQAALQQMGVAVHGNAEVVAWQRSDTRVEAALSRDGRVFAAGDFVVCGGAWSGTLLADVAPLPVRPVRGQMLLYRLEPGALPCIVLAEGRYVIPRRDGHVLCGSTLEETGFDKSTTRAALDSLRASAARLWPALREQEPVAHWAGLRPAAPEGVPFIGAVPGQENLWVNAGQFRNGLVLAPASARLLADLMLGRVPAIDPSPYQMRT